MCLSENGFGCKTNDLLLLRRGGFITTMYSPLRSFCAILLNCVLQRLLLENHHVLHLITDFWITMVYSFYPIILGKNLKPKA